MESSLWPVRVSWLSSWGALRVGEPIEVLQVAMRLNRSPAALVRAFQMGFTIPQIVEASGWSFAQVYGSIEGIPRV